jgi:hypothetical protein
VAWPRQAARRVFLIRVGPENSTEPVRDRAENMLKVMLPE